MIIVLTLGRSGSSLLMQTLQAFDVSVLGRSFDTYANTEIQAHHHSLNPKGYLEEPAIYYSGVNSPVFQEALKTKTGPKAVKMDLRHLSDPAQMDTWRQLIPKLNAVFLSYRTPAAQTYSEYLGTYLPAQRTNLALFLLASSFLRSYSVTLQEVLEVLQGPLADLREKVHPVDYAEAANPEQYVNRISQCIGFHPSPKQMLAAETNISPELLRVKTADIPFEVQRIADHLGVADSYEKLCRLRTHGWSALSP